jgi:hypothetical protein
MVGKVAMTFFPLFDLCAFIVPIVVTFLKFNHKDHNGIHNDHKDIFAGFGLISGKKNYQKMKPGPHFIVFLCR